ncbi:MAG TPA: C25 family cysteine peptidase [Rudaea sp.]|nr:C25 family cysteine peptidase [Rudaea sp.]
MLLFRRTAQISCAALIALAVPMYAQACAGSVHIELREPGVYALDQAAIVAAQPGLGDCRSDDLVLTQRGGEVPLRIVGDSGGRLVAGTRLEWVGEPLHGPQSWFDPYSTVNVYILSAAPGTHARMQAAAPAAGSHAGTLFRHVHFEQENELIRLNRVTMQPGEEPDFWQWAKLTHADPQPFTFAFDLPDLSRGGAAPAMIEATLNFRGISFINKPHKNGEKTTPHHVVEVTVNGKRVASLQWDERFESLQQVTLPRALLKAEGNVLGLQVPVRHDGDADNPIVDVVMFNWFELTYPIDGNLGASTAAFSVAEAAAKAPAIVELAAAKPEPVTLYGSDGRLFADTPAGAGRHRFAGVTPGIEVYPVVGSAFLAPVLVRAVADQDWRDGGGGQDYVIISHRSLIDAIAPLAEFHRRNGLKVAVIDVDQVYDQFNDGISHPVAIKNLIDYARAHWAVKPRYVLLVGTASFDIRESGKEVSMQPADFDPRTGVSFIKRNDMRANPSGRNLIPTWQYPSDGGQSASDNHFVANSDKDYHPALAIGRLPAVTPDEVAAIVRKTLNYATGSDVGSWRHRVMFIANENASFQSSSDEIARDVGAQGFAAEKIYGNQAEADNLAHQAAINDGLNSGELLVHFIGHGGRFIWRTGPPDPNKNHDLFTLADVSKLRNGTRLPMVLSMTCFSAPFDNPGEDSIGERFLLEPDKGAVAVFAASWTNAPSAAFSRKLVAELIKPGQTIGDAIVAAKQEINDATMVEMYNLLGDPALVLERPRDRVDIVRNGDRWQDAITVRVPEPGFGGEVTVDWVDAAGNLIDSKTYEARDAQFQLTVPTPEAAGVRIYAANYRSGRDALGTLDLRPPPPPAVVTATGKPGSSSFVKDPKPAAASQPAASGFVKDPKPAAAMPAPATGAAVAAPQGSDSIGRFGFDDKPAAAAAARTGKAARANKERDKAATGRQNRQ